MTILVAVVLTVLIFAFIVYPLLKRRASSVDTLNDGKIQELYSQRDATYSMLKELEFDLQSGTLSEDDYRDLEDRYKRKAVSILRDIDNLERGSDVEDEVEKKILELRQSQGQFCPQCGAKCRKDDRFCSHCGTSLSQGESID